MLRFAQASSEKLKLTAASNAAKISVPKLAAGKKDALVIELYEGETLRYRATRLQTQLEKSKANTLSIADCLVQKLPWDGLKNETACGWTISDVKN